MNVSVAVFVLMIVRVAVFMGMAVVIMGMLVYIFVAACQFVAQQFAQDRSVDERYLSAEFRVALVDTLPRGIDYDLFCRRDRQRSRYFIGVLVNSAHLLWPP
jgi:hypothetical protein